VAVHAEAGGIKLIEALTTVHADAKAS